MSNTVGMGVMGHYNNSFVQTATKENKMAKVTQGGMASFTDNKTSFMSTIERQVDSLSISDVSETGRASIVFANAALQNADRTTTGIVLHGKNDSDAGEESVGSWANIQTGVSTSVYKPNDFSEDNPYYHVKIWKPDGTMEERMVDVINFNPKSADSFEHYAYSCYLDKTEGLPVFTSFLLERSTDTVSSMFIKQDWLKAYKDKMQQQLDVHYMDGYLMFKKRYERMLKQYERIMI